MVPMNSSRRLFGLLGSFLVVAILGTGAALAADIGTVADDLATQAFYLDSGVSISASDATQIVSTARNQGSRFYLVVLDDTPAGGNTAYAEALYDELRIDAGTILVLSSDDVGVFSEDEGFTESDMNAALDYADEVAETDADYAAAFVVGLVGPAGDIGSTATTSAPATTAAAASASSDSSGGGGSGLLWLLVIVVGGGLLLFWLVRRGDKQTVNAAAEQMAKARAAVQKQVDAIANDILDIEDEVRLADNREVDALYSAASETYRTLTARLQQAETPEELLDLSNDLDLAIWQLDCAEALLDDKPKPTKPQPKRLEAPAPADDRVTVPAPRPDYQRRPGRRSSYMGPGLMEILIGVAGQVLAGGGTRRSGGLGGVFGNRTQRTTSRSGSGRGGSVVPGPGSPVRRSARRSSTPRSSSTPRRSGGGRVRVGRKRRK